RSRPLSVDPLGKQQAHPPQQRFENGETSSGRFLGRVLCSEGAAVKHGPRRPTYGSSPWPPAASSREKDWPIESTALPEHQTRSHRICRRSRRGLELGLQTHEPEAQL